MKFLDCIPVTIKLIEPSNEESPAICKETNISNYRSIVEYP